ncbi:hypothetical protein [Brevibacterium luteolum]|nr:hypothetical protein [Brevibacterium luteolum]MCT1657089.1 hypothetical protein [Brevibacterium luteolum]MCT1922415.1 hypothetical protein [Brevibacterium luteolum]
MNSRRSVDSPRHPAATGSRPAVEAPQPLRSPARTMVLFWLAAVSGVIMCAAYHWLQLNSGAALGRAIQPGIPSVHLIVDVTLGTLALAMLPAAIQHDPMEREDSYVGPPSALVAGLVILCVWMVSVLAAPAGAVVLISIAARLSANWTIPAFCASLLSIIVFQLALAQADASPHFALGAVLLTVTLIAMGSIRGVVLRRQERADLQRQS